MGLLSTKEKTPVENRIDELMSKPIHKSVKPHLKQTLKDMAKKGKSIDEIERYYQKTAAKTKFIESRRAEYVTEAKLADEVYKAYITDGLSRLDKVNGRFLASQSIKTDILIEQNNRIIELLETMVKGSAKSTVKEDASYIQDDLTTIEGKNGLPIAFCPECGNQTINGSKYCKNCGTKM